MQTFPVIFLSIVQIQTEKSVVFDDGVADLFEIFQNL